VVLSPEVLGFSQLSSVEQRVVAVLALVHEPVGLSLLLEWLAELPAAAELPQDPESLGSMLQRLSEAKVILTLGYAQKHTVSTELAQHALAELSQQPFFASWVAAAMKHAPRKDGRAGGLDRARVVRDLLLYAHLGDADGVTAVMTDAESARGRSVDHADLLFDALGLCPPASAVASLPPELRDRYLGRAVDEALDTLTPLGADLETWLGTAGPKLPPALLASCAVYAALRGKRSLDHALVGLADAEACAARAFSAMTQGEREQARELAREAFELSRDSGSQPRGGVPGHAGPWLTLLLLTSRDATLVAYAHAQLDAATRDERTFGHEAAYGVLNLLHIFVSKGVFPAQSPAAYDFSETEPAWERALLWSFATRAANTTAPKGLAVARNTCLERAEPGEFRWITEELKLAQERGSKQGLIALHTREEAWEHALSTLELAVEQGELPEGVERSQISWWLTLDRQGRHEIAARLERSSVPGAMAARSLSLKRLRELAADPDSMGEEDLSVVRFIRAHEEFPQRELVLDEMAITALVAHPRVFMQDTEQRVDVVRGTPQLDVKESMGGLTVRVTPSLCAERRVVCLPEAEGRVIVYAQSEAQKAIASRISSNGLSFPLGARDRVGRMLPRLSRQFQVASEVSIPESAVSTQPADSRIHVQLSRHGAGMRVRLRVVPLAGGPSLDPGAGETEFLAICVTKTGPTAARTTRDLDAERLSLDALIEACPRLSAAEQTGYEYRVPTLHACLELLGELSALGESIVIDWPEGQPISIVAERSLSDMRLKLTSASYWLSVDGELTVDSDLKLSLRELLAGLARSEGRFLALSAGRFVALSDQLKAELEALAGLAQIKGTHIELHPLALGGIDQWASKLQSFELDTEAMKRLQRVREAATLKPDVPTTLRAELRPYQVDGYTWLSRLSHWGAGACLADDMGLGKTLQALSLLLAQASYGPSLVIAPTSVTGNWIDEMQRFAPSLRVVRLTSEERDKTIETLGAGDVLVCSYGIMQQSIEALEQRSFRMVVLDEAQSIKNATTQRAKAAMRLVGEMRLALTGTPIENHLGELWSIMTFLNPGLLGSSKNFEQRFARPIQRDRDARASENLKRIVHPFILRRKKGDVLSELPEKTVVTLHITPSDKERALYAALREQALSRIGEKGKPNDARMRLLAELMRMRRAACHPSLVAPDSDIPSEKLNAFEELVHELREEGHRALVFSQFVDYLSIVRARLDELGISYQYLDGSTPPAQRTEAVRNFQAGQGDLFLISLRAGGFGLNLTAADYVIHLDPWWNPAVEDQASDRAHRIGQTRPVTIYRMVMEGSIEEKILALHDDKREIADRLLEGTDTGKTLSVETLTSLIRDVGQASAPYAPGELTSTAYSE